MVAGWYATCAAKRSDKMAPLQLRNADWYHILVKTAAFWHPKRPVGWKWKAAIRKLTEPRAELQECVTCLCNFEACSLRLAIKIRCHMWRGHFRLTQVWVVACWEASILRPQYSQWAGAISKTSSLHSLHGLRSSSTEVRDGHVHGCVQVWLGCSLELMNWINESL